MKKWFGILLAILLLCAFGAQAAGAPVVDEADLFTAAQEAELEQLIAAFQETTEMDFVVYTSDAAHSASQMDIAAELYDRGGYGLGEENSGVIYYIDMYERIPTLVTTGAMIDYLTDERIEAAHNGVYGALASGAYADAAQQMIYAVADYVESGIPEGQYQYDIITGQVLTARHKVLTSSELLVCALIGLIAAMLYVKSVQGSYHLKGSTYEYHFRENSNVTITDSQDDYLRTTTTRTRKAPPPSSNGGGSSRSGGSGTFRSSGGVRHGGGSGKRF